MNFGAHAFVNVPEHIERIARAVRAANVKPELEVFDLGHCALAEHLFKQGVFAEPAMYQLCLGIPWGAPATTSDVVHEADGPGQKQLERVWHRREGVQMVAQSVILGGHVRVGLEDNLFLSRAELSPGNGSLVGRAARIVKELGAEVATASQAREILRLG